MISNVIQILLSLQPQQEQKLEIIYTKKTLHDKTSNLEKQENRSSPGLYLSSTSCMTGTSLSLSSENHEKEKYIP